MTRRTRKTVFYVLLGLFFILGSAVVLFAEGWRIDFATWRPEKVGAIFVRSFPEYANITLNGKSVPNTAGFLSHGTLISDLYPRTYTFRLQETGYDPWQENTGVLPSLVTELKYAVLIPSEDSAIGSSTVRSFAIGAGGTVTENPNGAVEWSGTTIAHGTIVGASADLKTVLLENPSTGAYTLYDVPDAVASPIAVSHITSIVIDPSDATTVVLDTPSHIWIFDETQTSLSSIGQAAAGQTIGASVAVSASTIAWTHFSNASGTSSLVLYDRFTKTTMESTTTIPGATIAIAFITQSELGLLQADGSLYLYQPSAGTFQKLADDVTSFSATPDGSLIAALEENGLEIFSFTDAETYHRFNLPAAASATGLVWYKDEEHLFIIYPDHVSFLDMNDLGLTNFTTVADGTAPFYDPAANALYLIDPHSMLVRFDFPS